MGRVSPEGGCKSRIAYPTVPALTVYIVPGHAQLSDLRGDVLRQLLYCTVLSTASQRATSRVRQSLSMNMHDSPCLGVLLHPKERRYGWSDLIKYTYRTRCKCELCYFGAQPIKGPRCPGSNQALSAK